MIEVDLPDGSVAEFPDGTPDAVMEKALKGLAVESEAKKNVAQMSTLRKIGYGAERGFDEAAMGLKQIFPKALGGGLSKKDEHDLAVRRQMEDQIPGTTAGRIVGDLAMFAVPGANIAKAASMFPKAAKLAGYGAAALTGAGIGALQPTLEGESRGKNAASGAAFGAAGQGIGNAVGRAIEGVVPKSAAARMLPQEVQDAATLGQVADRATPLGRVVSGVEERIKSIPVLGSVIERGRERGVDAWRNAAIAKGAPDGFSPPSGTAREKTAAIYNEFQSRYGKALAGHQVNQSPMFESVTDRLIRDPKRGLSQQETDAVERAVMGHYDALFSGPTGQATGESAKKFESFLSARARNHAKGQGPTDPDIGRLYSDIERAWTAASRRQMGPNTRAALKPLDDKYAPYKTIERAAAAVGNTGGDFTPAQLTNSVAARTGKARFGRGEGMLADDAQAGKSVFMDRLPNSGTADRVMLPSSVAALAVDPVSTLTAAGGVAATLPLFTSKAGKNAMTGDAKLQKLLQVMRANQAARQLGAPSGIAAQDALVEESTRY